HVLGAQRLELAAVDGRGRQHVADLAAQIHVLLAHGPQVVGKPLDHRLDLLLLLAARIHRPAEAVDHAFDASGREEAAAAMRPQAVAAEAVAAKAVATPAGTAPAAPPVVVAVEPAAAAVPVPVAEEARAVGPLVAAIVGPAMVALGHGGAACAH